MNFAAQRLTGSKPEVYRELGQQVRGIFEGERDAIANAANLVSLVWHGLEGINWVGFYFLRGSELVLGPFQGKPACVRIAMGNGVCGTAAAKRETVVVGDVDAFPSHIVCDSASRSEIVVPLVREGDLIGVLDMDAPTRGRFDEADRAGLEILANLWLKASDPF